MNDRDIVRLRVSLRAFNVMEGHNAARGPFGPTE